MQDTAARRPLRVCHLAYTFYENDNRVIRYAESLAERGDAVDVIALRRPGQSSGVTSNGVRLYRIQRRSVNERSPLSYLFKILLFAAKSSLFLAVQQLRKRYDVVHVHNVPDFLVFAAVVPKLMGARVILDIHDLLPEFYRGKFGASERSVPFRMLRVIERLSCRFADHTIVANHLWHEKLIRRSVPPERCTTILNYPDLRLFMPLPPRPLGAPFVVMYPGTLNYHQGLDIAVKAFARVHDKMPDAEFHIYGEGPERQELARLIHLFGMEDNVKLLNRVPFKEISRIMATASVGIVPKRADGFGNEAFSTKVLEFMACGVPLIVAKTQVDAHYFNDALVRFFVPGDEADLANALLWAYEHREDHAQQAVAARAFAVSNGWHARVEDYLQVIDSRSGG